MTIGLALMAMARADEPPQPNSDAGEIRELAGDDKAPRMYSLGTGLRSIPKELDAQLKLQGKGALIAEVVVGSPADKAGLKENDVLLEIDGAPITGMSFLHDQLQSSAGKEVTLKVLSAGDESTVKVQPNVIIFKNPHPSISLNGSIEQVVPGLGAIHDELKTVEEKIREKLKDAGVDIRIQFVEPGHVVPPGIAKFLTVEKVPENLDIHIHKRGGQPAEIEVRQDDQTWNVKESELDQLPAEVRKHVERLLGRRPKPGITIGANGQKFEIALPPGTPPLPVPPEKIDVEALRKLAVEKRTEVEKTLEHARKQAQKAVQRQIEEQSREVERIKERARGTVERRLEELSREMERMQQRMEDLRKAIADEAPDKQPAEQGSENAAEGADQDGDAAPNAAAENEVDP